MAACGVKKQMSRDTTLPASRAMLTGQERLLKYKTLAVAFSYPEGAFFDFFPSLTSEKQELQFAYDRIFRSGEVWLYGLEYMAENEFQRAHGLADISGFYKAFAVETDSDRPDALNAELEFMHYLIHKEIRTKDKDKVLVCFDAQKKFFNEHLYPAGEKIAQAVISKAEESFYAQAASEMLDFLKNEERLYSQNK
ncbi:MAG: hypothetical protein A3I43_01715 [Omnitrophica WOR_2 bacterium RIFCSPLOWO2_02_FULL_50_19]|nr:MAG: hypothetical protein A3I43_01715 [Omnitrophica WOR_2 bacterium RIFCSPLOWO2_02_FULL_50_19]